MRRLRQQRACRHADHQQGHAHAQRRAEERRAAKQDVARLADVEQRAGERCSDARADDQGRERRPSRKRRRSLPPRSLRAASLIPAEPIRLYRETALHKGTPFPNALNAQRGEGAQVSLRRTSPRPRRNWRTVRSECQPRRGKACQQPPMVKLGVCASQASMTGSPAEIETCTRCRVLAPPSMESLTIRRSTKVTTSRKESRFDIDPYGWGRTRNCRVEAPLLHSINGRLIEWN